MTAAMDHLDVVVEQADMEEHLLRPMRLRMLDSLHT